MKQALIADGPKAQIIDSPMPKPEPDQLVIRVVVSGSNPKDWKVPMWTGKVLNQGDDIAGVVHEVGSDVYEFKPGDRVAAFHHMLTPYGSYGEYALARQHATFHIPKKLSFEEAATLPLAALTAAIGLYSSEQLDLPTPWAPATEPTPLVIYGASSAVGSYALQLAQRSNIHPVVAVAGRAAATHVEALIDRSKGDAIVDYRGGDDAVVEGIAKALADAGAPPLRHVYDAVSEKGSVTQLSRVLSSASAPSAADVEAGRTPSARITFVLPGLDYPEIPAHVRKSITGVGAAHQGGRIEDLAHVFLRLIARGLYQGWFRPHPHEVIPGGLNGVQKGLENLRDGKASAVKYVFRIAETPGLHDEGISGVL